MFYNYYQVLGVRESASDDEMKKAYRVCAMKWHPDRYSGPDANEKMALINEAYTILRDREARCKYDAELARLDFSHYFRWLFANFRERFLSS